MNDKFEPELFERFRDLSKALELLKKSMADGEVNEIVRNSHENIIIGYLCEEIESRTCDNDVFFGRKEKLLRNIDYSIFHICTVINTEWLVQLANIKEKKKKDNMIEISEINRAEQLEKYSKECCSLVNDDEICLKVRVK